MISEGTRRRVLACFAAATALGLADCVLETAGHEVEVRAAAALPDGARVVIGADGLRYRLLDGAVWVDRVTLRACEDDGPSGRRVHPLPWRSVARAHHDVGVGQEARGPGWVALGALLDDPERETLLARLEPPPGRWCALRVVLGAAPEGPAWRVALEKPTGDVVEWRATGRRTVDVALRHDGGGPATLALGASTPVRAAVRLGFPLARWVEGLAVSPDGAGAGSTPGITATWK